MKKNKKYIIIAVAALVVLVGALLALIFWPKGEDDPNSHIDNGTELTTSVDENGVHQASLVLNEKGELDRNSYGTLLSYAPADISTIDVSNTSGSYQITSYTPTTTDEEGDTITDTTQYTLVGFEDFQLQTGKPDAVANNVASLEFTSVASVDGKNASDFGFDSPRSTATVTYNDGTKAVITVGAEAPAGAGSYVKFGSGEPIYLVQDSAVEALLYNINDLISLTINDSVPSGVDSNPDSVTLSGTNFADEVQFVKNTDGTNSASYVLTKPNELVADENKTSLVTGALRGLYAESVAYVNPTQEQISACGLDNPAARVVAEFEDTTIDLSASAPDSEGKVTLMSNGGKVIYRMASANLPWSTIKYEDLVSSYVLNPTLVAVKQMVVNDGSKDYTFEISSKVSNSTDSNGSETTTTETTVNCGALNLTTEYFSTYFQNLAYTEKVEKSASSPSGSPSLTITYSYNDKDSEDVVSYYSSSSGKFIAVVNGTAVGTVYQSRINKLIAQTSQIASDESVETITT